MKEYYEKLYQTVLREHEKVFEAQSLEEIDALMEAVGEAKRIFVMGVGREGIAARSFAMRLMHLGKEVHWIWDDTTPGMGESAIFTMWQSRPRQPALSFWWSPEGQKRRHRPWRISCFLSRPVSLTVRTKERFLPYSPWEICLSSICFCCLISL